MSVEEKTSLQHSLKILKVLNFLVKNYQLFCSQGVKFLMNKTDDDEEMKEPGFSDFDV